MKWVSDTTGRFEWRPYYDQAELDHECEQIVSDFLRSKNSVIRFPISTDDLSVLVEQSTSDLDLYADLSPEGEDIEGVTDFFPHQKPAVKIAQELSLESARYNRLRTTLAHEYGHVRFHSFLWDLARNELPALKPTRKLAFRYKNSYQAHQTVTPGTDRALSPHPSPNTAENGLFPSDKAGSCFRCKRGRILDAPLSDWMEWQASYIGGAVLMPLSQVEDQVQKYLPENNGRRWMPIDSEKARDLTACIAQFFDVSAEAARVRLLKLGFLQMIPIQKVQSAV
jgi:Zn-dependent peptidase ImmA (M78 family)